MAKLIAASIDFETRSRASIKLGLERYSKDEQADVLTLSYRLPGGEVRRWNRGPHLDQVAPPPLDLFAYVQNGGLVRGWNVMFEWYIWNNVCVPKYGWPPLDLEQLLDTMAQAAAHNLPQALGRCGEVLGLDADKQKSTRGKYLIQRLCVPHKPTKKRPGVWVEDEDLFSELCDYCDQDVVAEEEIARKLRPLSEYEQRLWVMTQRINLRGVPVAVDEIANICEVVEREKDRLNLELRQITGGAVSGANARNDLVAWLNSRGEKLDPWEIEDPVEDEEPLVTSIAADVVESMLKREDLQSDVRRVLEIRASVCQTSTKKFSKILEIVADDNTVKNLFVYHGAGPGRWASRGGLNVQNFTRPTLGSLDVYTAQGLLGYGTHEVASVLFGESLMDAAVSCLRGIIKAPEGFEFIDADFSSIENRVAAWIAGQDDKLEMFAQGLDEYKTFASRRLFNCAYEEVTPKQRQYTKPVILGGIFGLGHLGLMGYAEGYGVKMDEDQAKEAITALRLDYKKVRDCWYACEDAALEAIREPGFWFKAGRLEFCVYKNFLWMKLPSGRLISWYAPLIVRVLAPWTRDTTVDNPDGTQTVIKEAVWKDGVSVMSIETGTRAFRRHILIGSSAFQSGVQGTARDILANGLFNVEEAGYPVVLMVHDELMALVLKGWGDPEEFGRLMCKPAEWFKDLPMAFEAWRGDRYRK